MAQIETPVCQSTKKEIEKMFLPIGAKHCQHFPINLITPFISQS